MILIQYSPDATLFTVDVALLPVEPDSLKSSSEDALQDASVSVAGQNPPPSIYLPSSFRSLSRFISASLTTNCAAS